jgi:hypothetical protein
MKVYVIILFDYKSKDRFSIEPVGIYSSLKVAKNWMKKLENKSGKIFDLFEYNIDEKPCILDYIEEQEDKLSGIITRLLKLGLIDQLIGEDGNFYYKITELGKQTTNLDLQELKKFIK